MNWIFYKVRSLSLKHFIKQLVGKIIRKDLVHMFALHEGFVAFIIKQWGNIKSKLMVKFKQEQPSSRWIGCEAKILHSWKMDARMKQREVLPPTGFIRPERDRESAPWANGILPCSGRSCWIYRNEKCNHSPMPVTDLQDIVYHLHVTDAVRRGITVISNLEYWGLGEDAV